MIVKIIYDLCELGVEVNWPYFMPNPTRVDVMNVGIQGKNYILQH
jgi:hypothetical protein